MGDIHHYQSGTALNIQANGHGGNKHEYITSKGVLYSTKKSPGGGIAFWRSMDNGDTWIYNGELATGTVTCGAEYSIFCDEEDMIHVVYAKWQGSSSDARTDKSTIMYVHGVHTADHQGHYWSTEVALTGYDYWHCPDVVAHEHNGQIRAHVMFNYSWSANDRHITAYARVLTNIGDTANHVVEQAATFLHDVTGAGFFPGKVSVELRHAGDGKTPQTVSGYRTPDVLYTFTSSNLVHYGRVRWNGGNTWVSSELIVLDYTWGNLPSNSSSTMYGGLYEHHRWLKTLYSPRDNQVVVVGWVAVPGFSQQALCLWEVAIGASARNIGMTLHEWPRDSPYGDVSGTATLDPDGNVFIFSTVEWTRQYGWTRILRPKGSLARSASDHVGIDTDLPTGDGARASLLPYPQGEQHAFYLRANQVVVHWRNNRTCNFVQTGGALVRRPKFRLDAAGRWVPVQEVAL